MSFSVPVACRAHCSTVRSQRARPVFCIRATRSESPAAFNTFSRFSSTVSVDSDLFAELCLRASTYTISTCAAVSMTRVSNFRTHANVLFSIRRSWRKHQSIASTARNWLNYIFLKCFHVSIISHQNERRYSLVKQIDL